LSGALSPSPIKGLIGPHRILQEPLFRGALHVFPGCWLQARLRCCP
jgi:hypothetical protein